MATQKTITLYTYDELDETAKAYARDWYLSGDFYGWHEENRQSLEAFMDKIGAKAKDWEYGGYQPSITVVCDWSDADIKGKQLRQFLWTTFSTKDLDGNCPFTGYCMDETLLDVVREELANTSGMTLEELAQEAGERWARACQNDFEAAAEEEQVAEAMEANGYTFTEDGTRMN